MKLPIFADAINKCDRILKPRGVDIKSILTSLEAKTFDNILNSFVGIAAIQVRLLFKRCPDRANTRGCVHVISDFRSD